jgi:haloalkane dehalogenase
MKVLIGVIVSVLLMGEMSWAEEVSPGVFRTPDARFENLVAYPYSPNYMQIEGLRVHYLDEGPVYGTPIFLLHGEPTWSYLYRKMIPVFTAAGYRVIVPDLVGFGKSDKPAYKSDYSYQMQVDIMLQLVQQLDLQGATFFGQDWGGLIGLRVVAAEPQRFASVVVSNTGLPDADGFAGMVGYPLFKLAIWWQGPITMEELQSDVSFTRWVGYNHNVDDLPVGELMGFMGADGSVQAAYEAPFPDRRYKAAAQAMPYLVPSQLQANADAWKVFESWDKPFLVAFGDSDPITAGGEEAFLSRVPGAQNVTVTGAGHFVQEDAGAPLAQLIVDFLAGAELPASIDANAQ